MNDLLLPRHLWVRDNDVKACCNCKAPFGILFPRRHHCRVCGKIFCSKCSDHFLNSQDFKLESQTAIRVCEYCFETTIRNLLAQMTQTIKSDLKIRSHSTETKANAQGLLDTMMLSFLDAIFSETLKELSLSSKLQEEENQILNGLILECLKQLKTKKASLNRIMQTVNSIKVKKIPYQDRSQSRICKGLMIRYPALSNLPPGEMKDPRVLFLSAILPSEYEISGVADLVTSFAQESPISFIKNIVDYRPNLIISQHPIQPNIQKALLEENIYTICQPRKKQFDQIVQFFGAKVIKKLSQIEEHELSLLGSCSKVKIINYNNENYYKYMAKDGAKCSTLIHFVNEDSSSLAHTIIISGPDYNELKKAKEYLKNCLFRWAELFLEKEMTLHEILLFYGTKTPLEFLNALRLDFDESDLVNLMASCKEFFGDDLKKSANSEFLNLINAQSVGFLCNFLPSDIKPSASIGNRSLKYAKLNLVNVNRFDFDRISADDYLNFSKSLQKHKDKKLDAIAQICGLPAIKSSDFYTESDISLGDFLRKKSEMVIEECNQCDRPRYYHTSFCYNNRTCVKISTQVIGSIKEARIFEELKKFEMRSDEIEENLRVTAFPEEAKSNQPEENGIQQTSAKKVVGRKSPGIKDKSEIMSFLGSSLEKKASKAPFKMYIECNTCRLKTTEEVELSGSYTEYSFSKYLDLLFSSCDTFSKLQDPQQSTNLTETCELAGPRSSDYNSMAFANIKTIKVNGCCFSSDKSRVFNYEDDVLIKFTCVPTKIFDWVPADTRDPETRKKIEKLNEKKLTHLVFKYSSNFKTYMNRIIGFFDEFILGLGGDSEAIDSDLQLETLLNNKAALLFENSQIFSLLPQFILIKAKLQALKISCDSEFMQVFTSFLQVEKTRKKIFDEIIDCCVKLFEALSNLKMLIENKGKPQRSFTLSPKASYMSKLSNNSINPNSPRSPLEMPNYFEARLKKTSGSNINESGVDDGKKAKAAISFNSNQEKVSSANSSMQTNMKSKESLIKLGIKDPANDEEKSALENIIEGMSGPDESLKPPKEFLPVSDKHPLSPIAFALNHPQYFEKLELITGNEFENFGNDASQVKEKLLFREGNLTQIDIQSNFTNIYYPGFNHSLKLLTELFSSEKPSAKKKYPELKDLCLKVISGLRFSVSVLYPMQFHILRSLYGVKHQEFIQALALSEVWQDNNGGKSKAKFVKSFDNLYVFKEISQAEFTALVALVPDYLSHLVSLNIHTTLIAKIFGVYKIHYRDSGKTVYYIGMENVLFGIEPTRVYDLKGSEENRYIQNPKDKQVRLDSNFKIDQNGEPIEITVNRMNSLLNIISNDARFLSQHQKIDYSLILVLDDKNLKFRVCIIDYLVEFTANRKLESFGKSFVKKAAPTIVDPETYKKRFLLSMQRYFVGIPSD